MARSADPDAAALPVERGAVFGGLPPAAAVPGDVVGCRCGDGPSGERGQCGVDRGVASVMGLSDPTCL